jgi:hypothetical protein
MKQMSGAFGQGAIHWKEAAPYDPAPLLPHLLAGMVGTIAFAIPMLLAANDRDLYWQPTGPIPVWAYAMAVLCATVVPAALLGLAFPRFGGVLGQGAVVGGALGALTILANGEAEFALAWLAVVGGGAFLVRTFHQAAIERNLVLTGQKFQRFPLFVTRKLDRAESRRRKQADAEIRRELHRRAADEGSFGGWDYGPTSPLSDPARSAHCVSFQVLGLDSSASSKDIKDAFRTLTKQFHPDLQSGADPADRALAEEQTALIVAAVKDLRAAGYVS